jgi:hypothetical protein
MPAWVVVYCQRDAGGLRAAELTAALDHWDLLSLGEDFGLRPQDVRAGRQALVLGSESIAEGFGSVEIWLAPGGRPIQVRRERALGRASVTEQLARLDGIGGAAAAEVRAHLQATLDVVSFELGVADSLGMGGMVVQVAALEVAKRFAGLCEFYGRTWVDGRNAVVLEASPTAP